MTISKEAIQHLEKTVLLNDVNVELSQANTKTPLLAMPNSISLENLESYMPNRSSYRMKFATKSINDFALYAEEYDKQGAKCFVDSDDMSSKIIFDLGTEELPEHQRHSAYLKLNKTSVYTHLLDLNGRSMTQKNAANFIQDWQMFLTVQDSAGASMTAAQAANALTKMTIETARSITSEMDEFSNHMSAMEKAEVKGREKMPSVILFNCIPFNGLQERSFKVVVSVLTGGDRPEISFRIIGLENIKEEIVEEFKDKLVEKFKDSEMKTFIGSC